MSGLARSLATIFGYLAGPVLSTAGQQGVRSLPPEVTDYIDWLKARARALRPYGLDCFCLCNRNAPGYVIDAKCRRTQKRCAPCPKSSARSSSTMAAGPTAFFQPFPTHAAALAAAQAAAAEQKVPQTEEIEFEDEKGRWHTETARGSDRPDTHIKDKDHNVLASTNDEYIKRTRRDRSPAFVQWRFRRYRRLLQGLFVAHVTDNFVTLGAALVLGSHGVIGKILALREFILVIALARFAGAG